MDDIQARRAKRICDALRRGNTRKAAAALGGISYVTFWRWAKEDPQFKAMVVDAEAFAEDEAVGLIRSGTRGWQGPAWWLERRHRGKWALESKRSDAANSNGAADLSDVPLVDLEAALEEAAELKRAAAVEKKGA